MRAVVVLFLGAVWGFQFVKAGFFPASTTPQLVIDYWLPEGTDIERTKEEMIVLEEYASKLDGVTDVQTLIGAGGLRFMLVYGSESNNSAYGQLLLKLSDYKLADQLMPIIQGHLDQNFPNFGLLELHVLLLILLDSLVQVPIVRQLHDNARNLNLKSEIYHKDWLYSSMIQK